METGARLGGLECQRRGLRLYPAGSSELCSYRIHQRLMEPRQDIRGRVPDTEVVVAQVWMRVCQLILLMQTWYPRLPFRLDTAHCAQTEKTMVASKRAPDAQLWALPPGKVSHFQLSSIFPSAEILTNRSPGNYSHASYYYFQGLITIHAEIFQDVFKFLKIIRESHPTPC